MEFRSAVFNESTVSDLTFLLNRGGWAFDDMEPRYTIGLFSLRRGQIEDDPVIPIRGPYATMHQFRLGVANKAQAVRIADVRNWTDTLALPVLPTEESLSVFAQIRSAPRLDCDGDWKVRFYTELHATADRGLFTFASERPHRYWPVYKGESFDVWNPDTGAYYAWAEPTGVESALLGSRKRSYKLKNSPYFGLGKDWAENRTTLSCLRPRIAFRDVARATDTRTIRAALVPSNIFIVHLAPCVLFHRGDERDEAFLLGLLSSLALDWYARRFVETHLTFHVLEPFPVPRPSRENPLWSRTVELAGRLASPDHRFDRWARAVGVDHSRLEDDQKLNMIHELDAVVAHLYGLKEEQLRHIFETFHEGWDYRERLEATIEHFRRWQNNL